MQEHIDLLIPSSEERTFNLKEAYAYCERVTRRHYENFPVASFLLPGEKRRHLYSIYAFARGADDLADEGNIPAVERIVHLTQWQQLLDQSYAGKSSHPVFVALGQTVRELDIPKEYFSALLAAFRQDVIKQRYETFDELIEYCKNSANPVGRIVLHIFGYRDENLYRYSDFICTGLQLANFWQDLEIDLAKNRIYIPLEDMVRFDYNEGELTAKRATPEFRRLMQLQIERTRALFSAGYRLTQLVGKDLRTELRLTWFGGIKILEKIEQMDYNVFGRRPRLHLWDVPGLIIHALSRRSPSMKRRTVHAG
ncbi:MAG: squalene synthase HpnC [Bacteroidota bacterium]